ncbi:hypothetical protein V1227_24665 [Lentzea sp. DG1S-22]|uniref:hypothetical protein n=1 Tax=Lentzea sp. DG1S-22 TaxID=3108822 RepID=UPI002E788A22|nr:hypothetical protein [Lentzea sp. DG1S-22]WVH78268.1 hypothetical protein V1227_24665 [Lentzea sp. DG1S-22]
MNNLGGSKALFVVAVALTAAGCSPVPVTGQGDQQPVVQEKTFDVTGFGKLKPGMSKQDALASGELAATGAGRSGTCEDYRYQGAPARDAKESADETAAEQQLEAAQKAADEAEAAVGPMPNANAGAAAFAAHAAKAAASAEAGARAAELAAASAQRGAERAEAREANGGVLFAGDRIRLLLPPPGVKSAKGIAAGATVDDVKAAYPTVRQRDEKTWDVPVPDQPGTVLSFHFANGKLVTFLLFNADAKCS